MWRESGNCCSSQEKLGEKSKCEAESQSKAAFVLLLSSTLISSSSVSHREPMFNSWIMFNFWLLTNLICVTTSIKKEFQPPTACESIGGCLTLLSWKLHRINQIILVYVQKPNQKWKAGILEFLRIFMSVPLCMRSGETKPPWLLIYGLKGTEKPQKWIFLSQQVLFLNSVINTRCLLS